MKKIIFACICMGLTACVKTEIQEIKYNEIGASKEFDGRIYTITCKGNKSRVQNKCLTEISNFAYSKGYEYFLILLENHYMDMVKNTYQPTTNVYNTTNVNVNLHQPGTVGGYIDFNETLQSVNNNTGLDSFMKGYNDMDNFLAKDRQTSQYSILLLKEKEKEKTKTYYKVKDYCDECDSNN